MEDLAVAETAEDIAYVRARYVTLEELAHGRSVPIEQLRAWAGTQMPRATYALADGEQRYAVDWWRLYDDAGSIDAVRPLFERRLRAAGGNDGAWNAYVAGLWGACLRDVTPENMVAKERLVVAIDRALAAARPTDRAWCEQLRVDVEALDGLTRPFAACDRARFGGSTSRDRLIDGARAAYPHILAG